MARPERLHRQTYPKTHSNARIALHLGWVRTPVMAIAFLAVVAVSMPSIYLIYWALCGTADVGVQVQSPSLSWFRIVLGDYEWQRAIIYSVIVASIVAFLGACLSFFHFYYVRIARRFYGRVGLALIVIPVTMPAVIYGIALRIGGAALHLPELVLLIAGHTALVLPFQFFIFESSQERLSTDILHAAHTLGASHGKTLMLVYAPLAKAAFFASCIVGFFASLDEIVIAAFVIDSQYLTVPLKIWNAVPRTLSPAPAVVSSAFLGLAAAAWICTLAVRSYMGRRSLENE